MFNCARLIIKLLLQLLHILDHCHFRFHNQLRLHLDCSLDIFRKSIFYYVFHYILDWRILISEQICPLSPYCGTPNADKSALNGRVPSPQVVHPHSRERERAGDERKR